MGQSSSTKHTTTQESETHAAAVSIVSVPGIAQILYLKQHISEDAHRNVPKITPPKKSQGGG